MNTKVKMAAVTRGSRIFTTLLQTLPCRSGTYIGNAVSGSCNCGFLSKFVRFNSNVFNNRNSPKKSLFQTSLWFTRRSKQVAHESSKHFVKKKETPTLLSTRVWVAMGVFGFGSVAGGIYVVGSPEDGMENLYKEQPIPLQYVYRFRDRLHEYKEMFAEPSAELLLPDPLPEPYIQPKYTLVIELTDVLVHPEYSRESGWRFRKRPGLAAFLKALTMPLFEIVIFTHEAGFSAAPVVEGLDPEGFIMYKLFRDATKYTNGVHVKDLSKLNRDITKVILLDCDARTSQLQPRNSLVLKKWEGDPKDIALLELISFFHTIAVSNVDDVRPVLDFYRNEEDPVAAFRRNQDLLRQQQEDMMKAQQSRGSGSGLFGGFFGRRN